MGNDRRGVLGRMGGTIIAAEEPVGEMDGLGLGARVVSTEDRIQHWSQPKYLSRSRVVVVVVSCRGLLDNDPLSRHKLQGLVADGPLSS